MKRSAFDRLTNVFSNLSRRDIGRALLFAATAVPLTPVRIARAELKGVVVLGGACTVSTECRQGDMQAEAICADNGFTADGALNCCVESGCCISDADCCGDLRCAPTGDVCSVCRMPPFPTRSRDQLCASDDECIPSVVCTVACTNGRCGCGDLPEQPMDGAPTLPDLPDVDTSLAAAEELSRLEASSQIESVYDLLHPNAKAIVPFAVVAGWYADASPARGASPADALKIRFIPWTWEVTGQTYPNTAEFAYRQTLADGTTIRDEVRLVKSDNGVWRWFFGRDRDFVEEQIAQYGSGSASS